MVHRSRPTHPLSQEELAERRRDRFVWWTNGLMILLVLGIFVFGALDSEYMRVAP